MTATVAGAVSVHAAVVGEQPPVIELDGVGKTYASGSLQVEALRGVSLGIGDGEYVAVMGPSGSGKSTLMHILGCLDVPTAGSYRLSGIDVGGMSEIELARVRNRRIGFVFQQFNLLAHLPAWRNVEMPLAYAGVPRQQRRERAVAALDSVGLADRVDHRPGELSGGQQQRVAVARALVTNPDLILADEPTGNLESRSSREVLALFDQLHRSGRTVVVITHEEDVAQKAQRVLRISDGQLQHDQPQDRQPQDRQPQDRQPQDRQPQDHQAESRQPQNRPPNDGRPHDGPPADPIEDHRRQWSDQ